MTAGDHVLRLRALSVATLLASVGALGQPALALAADPASPAVPVASATTPSPAVPSAGAPALDDTAVLRPDVLVRTKVTISEAGRQRLAGFTAADRSVLFRAGTVVVPLPPPPASLLPSPLPALGIPRLLPSPAGDLRSGGLPLAAGTAPAAAAPLAAPTTALPVSRSTAASRSVSAVGVDPAAFKTFTNARTARTPAVWQSVARGEAVFSHDAAKRLGLTLGQVALVDPQGGGAPITLRVGAFATTGVLGADLVVDDATGRRLGLPTATGMLLAAAPGQSSVQLADEVRGITGAGPAVDLLTPPAEPTAFLTGSAAAKAFGAFSYRYYPDGTIEPDAAWEKANIRTETVPIMGTVTCHRLMLPQLRGALQEVQNAGLGDTLHTYSGCYVPRFMERNPNHAISLHTWGIAIDMDAATNYRGIRGTMDPRVVAIFKRWGFRWGGDWKYTDPMHFEIVTLIEPPR